MPGGGLTLSPGLKDAAVDGLAGRIAITIQRSKFRP